MDKYFEGPAGPIYWTVWTDKVTPRRLAQGLPKELDPPTGSGMIVY